MHNSRFGRPSFPKTPKPCCALWDGWVFENGIIYDDVGNHYTQRDVLLSYEAGLIVDGYYGKTSNILNLKKELEKRKRLLKIPKVCLIYEDENGIEEHTFNLIKE